MTSGTIFIGSRVITQVSRRRPTRPQKSIAITEKLLADKANDGRRKELLYVLGAMRHFVGNDPGAIKAFEEAGKLKYDSKELKAEQNKNYNEYLSKLIDEYSEMIRKGEGPRQK